jgi:polar amino acid transport system substrate-binding protein
MLNSKVAALIIIALLLSASLSRAQPKLLIVADPWPPFEFEDGHKASGIDVEIATSILNNLGIPFEIQFYPWPRAWEMLKNGEADAVFSTSRNAEREPFLYFPKEDMWLSEYVFFVRKDRMQPKFNGYEDAKNMTVGITAANSYHPSFWAAFPNIDGNTLNPHLEVAISAELNFMKLAEGHIDFFPLDKIVGLTILNKLGLHDKITYYPVTLFTKGYPMPFAKNSKYPNLKKISEKFEQALIAFKNSNDYKLILNKYMLTHD